MYVGKVLPLKGYKALRAFQAFHTLLLGLKMLPSHAQETYEEFYTVFAELDEADKERLVREAVIFVQLEEHEVQSLLSFCTDKNGIAYERSNIKNLGPDEMLECIVSVCMEIGKIKVDLVSEDEKKKFKLSPSISAVNS